MSAFKYPNCPPGWSTCSFKMGEITNCDCQCNNKEATKCERCRTKDADTTIYGIRCCYDCASKVYEERINGTIE